MNTRDACDYAAELLCRAGFSEAHASKKSEARYYRFSGRRGLLRLAAHASKVREIDGEPILARLTFLYANPREESRQCLSMTRDLMEAQTATAIGRFFLATSPDPD